MAGLTPADRVMALLEWGDVVEADAAIEAAPGDGTDGWKPLLWRGTRALMEGRFDACERLVSAVAEVGEQAGEPEATVSATLLLVALRREQQRPAEAEIALRVLLDRHAAVPSGVHAALASVVGEMGRDSQAHQELARLLPREPMAATGRLGVLCQLAELAASLEAEEEADLLYRRLLPHAGDFAVEDGAAAFYGSASLALGRLAQARGRWDEAVAHFEAAVEAHTRVGAPLLLAHTQRHLAALLRARGDDGDWERAVHLLDAAAGIYRQLGVDRLAAETQSVLARSRDGLGARPGEGGNEEPTLFRRQGDGWVIGPAGGAVRLRDARGLYDVVRLLAAPGTAIHVSELLARDDDGTQGPGDRIWSLGNRRPWVLADPVLDRDTRAEYEARLSELAGDLVEAERLGDAVKAALTRAERDALSAAMADGELGDPLERARRVVGARIRISLERIERSQPEVGHHLRMSIRTGTFCSYEPDRPVRWSL